MWQRIKHSTKLLAITAIICFSTVLPAYGQCEVSQLTGNGGLGRVASDGDVTVIGDTGAFGSLGAVYVFRKGPGGPDDWAAETTLMSPDPSTSDVYGRAVAISNNVIVVCAHHAHAPEFQRGAAYIFRYNPISTEWELETTLTASDGDMGDLFGYSVAIDGNVVVIGARDDENKGVSHSGSAYIFRYDPDISGWSEEAKLNDPNSEEFDLLGVSVSISGDLALIGAHGNDDSGSGTGAAFIFHHDPDNPGKWILEQQLQASDAKWQAWFGFNVSLRNNVAVIGAPNDDGQTGAAYVMRFNGKQWIHEAKLVSTNPVGPFPLMGSGVVISTDGNTVISGAPLDDEGGNEAGAAHLFRKDGGKWTEIAKLIASDGGPGQDFGTSLAINGEIALIKNGNSGSTKVYIFTGIQGIDCNNNGEPDACDIFDDISNDQNNNGIPDECDSDLDGNGSVGTSDLLMLLSNWGPCDECPSDLDGNGAVGTSDLLILLSNWG